MRKRSSFVCYGLFFGFLYGPNGLMTYSYGYWLIVDLTIFCPTWHILTKTFIYSVNMCSMFKVFDRGKFRRL